MHSEIAGQDPPRCGQSTRNVGCGFFVQSLRSDQHIASGSFAGDEVLHLAHPFYAIGMIARRTELLSRFPLQPVNDVFEGLEAAAAGRAGISIYAQLFVRARAVLENVVGTTHLIKASEGLCVISDQLDQLVENNVDRHCLHRLQVNESRRRAVTLCSPLVLSRDGARNRPESSIEVGLLHQVPNEATEQRGDAKSILDTCADIRDPQLQRGVLQGGPYHPSCRDQRVDVFLVVRERLEQVGKPRSRQLIVGGETVAAQAGAMTLPERLGCAQGVFENVAAL